MREIGNVTEVKEVMMDIIIPSMILQGIKLKGIIEGIWNEFDKIIEALQEDGIKTDHANYGDKGNRWPTGWVTDAVAETKLVSKFKKGGEADANNPDSLFPQDVIDAIVWKEKPSKK